MVAVLVHWGVGRRGQLEDHRQHTWDRHATMMVGCRECLRPKAMEITVWEVVIGRLHEVIYHFLIPNSCLKFRNFYKNFFYVGLLCIWLRIIELTIC